MKKLCIFDFDGTILNTMPEVAKCFENALKQTGFPTLTYKEYEQAVGGNIEQCISKILKNNNTPENIQKVKKAYEDNYYNDKNDSAKTYPGIHQLLQQLQQKNIKLAINSNRNADNIKKYNQKFINDIKFKQIKGYNPNLPPKPDPTNLLKIIENTKVTKEETIYIGDTIIDLNTAKNAEVDCIIVEWGQGNIQEIQKENNIKTIKKPEELLQYLEWYKMKKLLILDFDGTIFNTRPSIIKYFNKALTDCGYPKVTQDQLFILITHTMEEGITKILEENATPENIEKVIKTYKKYYTKHKEDFAVLFDGIYETLQKIQEKNILLAISSNAKTDVIKRDTKKCLNNINFIAIKGDQKGQPPKPDPTGVKEIIKTANVKPNETIYIGDTKTDYQTAKNAGIDFIFAKWGYGDIKELDEKHILKTIEKPAELYDVLCNI